MIRWVRTKKGASQIRPSSTRAMGRVNFVRADEPYLNLGQTQIAWFNAKRSHVQPGVTGCDRRFRKASRSGRQCSASSARRRRRPKLLILGGGASEIEVRNQESQLPRLRSCSSSEVLRSIFLCLSGGIFTCIQYFFKKITTLV